MCLTVFAILVRVLAGVLPAMEREPKDRWATELALTVTDPEFVVLAMVLKLHATTALGVT